MLCNNEDAVGVSKCFPNNPIFFKQLTISETLTIPNKKPDIEHIISTVIQPDIISMRIVDTHVGYSHGGQNLTGKKLIIELELIEKLKYVADEKTQSIHAIHYEKRYKSIFIVIPCKINNIKVEALLGNKKIIVTPYIEDIYTKKLDKRTIYRNITMLIDVIFVCLPNRQACVGGRGEYLCIE